MSSFLGGGIKFYRAPFMQISLPNPAANSQAKPHLKTQKLKFPPFFSKSTDGENMHISPDREPLSGSLTSILSHICHRFFSFSIFGLLVRDITGICCA